MSNLDFLDAPEGVETAAPVEQANTPAPEPVSDGPVRGPDGKFAPKATEAAQAPAITPEAPPAPAAPHEPVAPPPGYVPVSVVQELRREMQALRQPPPAPLPPPDITEDPDGYEAHQQTQRIALNAEWSHKLAVATHGQEAVQKAQEWAAVRFDQDPVFAQRSLAHPDPYGFAIAEHQREQALQLFTDPKLLNDFRAWQAAQAGQPPAQAPAAVHVAAPQAPTPPRSLAATPSAGGIKPGAVPAGPGEAFATVFKD